MAEPLALESGSLAQLRDFSSWVSAEQKRIFLLCLRILQDREEADSAAQDSFLKAYKALCTPGMEIEDPAKWLTRIAVNTCLDRVRSRRWQFWKRRPRQEQEAFILGMTSAKAPDAEAEMFARQIHKRLHLALDRLSKRQRTVFVLRHFEDCSIEEIGAILGLDQGTVKAHMFRAVAKVREELKDLYQVSARRGAI